MKLITRQVSVGVLHRLILYVYGQRLECQLYTFSAVPKLIKTGFATFFWCCAMQQSLHLFLIFQHLKPEYFDHKLLKSNNLSSPLSLSSCCSSSRWQSLPHCPTSLSIPLAYIWDLRFYNIHQQASSVMAWWWIIKCLFGCEGGRKVAVWLSFLLL